MAPCAAGCNQGLCVNSNCIPILQLRCTPGSIEAICLPGGQCAPAADTTAAPTKSVAPTAPEVCDPTIQFRCYSGSCIPLGDRCDGVDHCSDRSDELSCPKEQGVTAAATATKCDTLTELPCATSGCYLKSQYCDGIPNCADRSDEATCPRTATDAPQAQNNVASTDDGTAVGVLVVLVVLMILALGGFFAFRAYKARKE